MGIPMLKIKRSWDLTFNIQNGDPYTATTTSLYWDGPQSVSLISVMRVVRVCLINTFALSSESRSPSADHGEVTVHASLWLISRGDITLVFLWSAEISAHIHSDVTRSDLQPYFYNKSNIWTLLWYSSLLWIYVDKKPTIVLILWCAVYILTVVEHIWLKQKNA